jgi:hypothetical protein
VSRSSRGGPQRKRAVATYDPRTISLRVRTIVVTFIAAACAAFTGAAQYATWPQILLLHKIGWSVVAVLASTVLAGCFGILTIERRAYSALLTERQRQADDRKRQLDEHDRQAAERSAYLAGATSSRQPVAVPLGELVPVTAVQPAVQPAAVATPVPPTTALDPPPVRWQEELETTAS